jgi:L-serine dehydratase
MERAPMLVSNANSVVEKSLAQSTGPISVLDLFTIGVGPSSSHTVGPMRAALRFVEELGSQLARCTTVRVEIYGSLALTGKGHCTDSAIMLGLSGWEPETVEPDSVATILGLIRQRSELPLGGKHPIAFREAEHLVFRMGELLPRHSNGMKFVAFHGGQPLLTRIFYSIGGGAIVADDQGAADSVPYQNGDSEPLSFATAVALLELGRQRQISIANIVRINEQVRRDPSETDAFLDRVRDAMMNSISRGCSQEGVLPGSLKVRRRAPELHRKLSRSPEAKDPLYEMEWVSLFALAVNEENAAGGRVVTAPTNGAAGVIPAVLKYHETFFPNATPETSRTFLLTAAAIGMLYKKNASISAAEMGCQGEIGVACSMAAAGLAAVLGGTNEQIENAAEIGMEHNLGLTCDPIGGLVQIPCIERNTMGAIKAINAAMLALRGDGQHRVSLDAVIETMRQTGHDMRTKYKETSLGGLAVNVVDC